LPVENVPALILGCVPAALRAGKSFRQSFARNPQINFAKKLLARAAGFCIVSPLERLLNSLKENEYGTQS
jgi:hypothetical protein